MPCLGWWHGLRGQPLPYHCGTKGPAAQWLDGLDWLLSYPLYVLLPLYSWLVLRAYRRYTRYLDDNFSDAERLRFAGLRQLLVLQVLSWPLSLLFELTDVTFSYDEAWNCGLLLYGLLGAGVQANYAAATSPPRFEPDGVGEASTTTPAASTATPGSAPAIPGVLETIAGSVEAIPGASTATPGASETLSPNVLPWRERLLRLMADECPWLEPELTLTELAQRLRTHPALLSKVINAGCGQNFNDFVNTCRVQEARRKLADPRFGHYSLVGVALESGFNSKSTFNRVFKKLLGQAPSEVARPKS